MHSLKVRRAQVTIPLCGRKVSVPQCALQGERIPAPAEVVGSVAVPGRVKRAGWWLESYLAAKLLHATEDVSPAQRGPFPRSEDKPIAGGICNVTHQAFAEFGTEGDNARLVPLPVQAYQQVVEVNGVSTQRQHFADTRSHIEKEKHDEVRPQFGLVRLVGHQPMNLLLRIHGQIVLRFLEPGESRMLAARPALCLG